MRQGAALQSLVSLCSSSYITVSGIDFEEAFCYSVSIAPMIESIYFLGFLNTFSSYPKQVLVNLLLFPAQYVSRRGLHDLNMFFELQRLTQQCQFLIFPSLPPIPWKDMFLE